MVSSILSKLIDYSSTVQNVSTRKTETLNATNEAAAGGQKENNAVDKPKVQAKQVHCFLFLVFDLFFNYRFKIFRQLPPASLVIARNEDTSCRSCFFSGNSVKFFTLNFD